MSKPNFVIISGPPAAGKSTAARPLADALGYPLLCMDDIKEHLADAIGPDSRLIADHLGTAAVEQILKITSELLDHDIAVVVEGFFQSDLYSIPFAQLCARSNAVLVHIRADDAVLKDRYEHRAFAEERHWIHGDIEHVPHMTPELPEYMARMLDLNIQHIVIDTTFGPIDIDEVAMLIHQKLGMR